MARYLLVQVNENERAENLRTKLDGVEGIDVIAVFGKPTKFCECAESSERSVRGANYGWYVCPTCHAAKLDQMQYPMNLLDKGVPAVFRNVFLTIREPYKTPEERTGVKAIEIFNRQMEIRAQKNSRRRPKRSRIR